MLVHVGSNPYLTHTHLLSKILVNDRSVIFFFSPTALTLR